MRWALALALSLAAAGAAAQDRAADRGSGDGCVTTEVVGPVVRAPGSGIARAFYWEPTTRYPHGALGDDVEGAMLLVMPEGEGFCDIVPARDGGVFEDVAPRIADVTGDGRAEVIVVSSHPALGARVEVWGYPLGPGEGSAHGLTLIAATDPIGTRFRWLAIAGIADLDGDGRSEIAYVDRPHLAKVGRLIRLSEDGTFQEFAQIPDVTNHPFGAPSIEGGIRTCGDRPEVIWLSGDRTRILSTAVFDEGVSRDDIGPYSPEALAAAMRCG